MTEGTFSPLEAPITIVHSNLDQEVIQITEDRLRLVLKDHLEDAEERKAWIAPLGILMAIVTSFVTATFRDFHFKAATWEAAFLIGGLLSLGWLVVAAKKAAKAPTIDDIVDKIKRKADRAV